MPKYHLTIQEETGPASVKSDGITIPFDSEDTTLDIAARVIAALNQKRRGPRKAKATEASK